MNSNKKIAVLPIILLLIIWLLICMPTKHAEAGMMWWGKQSIFIPPVYQQPRIVPTSIITPAWLNPNWFQWNIGPPGGRWYRGFARDRTTILPSAPFFTPAGAIGVWDPLPTMYLDDDIFYYEFFVGRSDDASDPFGWVATSLPSEIGIQNNEIIGNYTGTTYAPDAGFFVDTTFDNLAFYVDEGSMPATLAALGNMDATDRIVITRFTVMLADVVTTPEPCTLLLLASGLMALAGIRKKLSL